MLTSVCSSITVILISLSFIAYFFVTIPLHHQASLPQSSKPWQQTPQHMTGDKPLTELSITSINKHYSPYAHIRSSLDYTYHSHYPSHRQSLQDTIISHLLNVTNITDVNDTTRTCHSPSGHHWIVFTAGAMGAGKTHTVRYMASTGRFPLDGFVRVDPDDIRRHLPEFETLVKEDPGRAGELTRKEAGYISEILTAAALERGRNVLVDGSLRDWEWYGGYFGRLRRDYGALKIAILHVTAPHEAVLERAAKRSLETGRVVPLSTLEDALKRVPQSIQILKPLVDFFCELNNAPGASDVEIVTEGTNWDSFQNVWRQTCPIDRPQIMEIAKDSGQWRRNVMTVLRSFL